ETLSFIATVSGSYRVEVRPYEQVSAGRYEIKIADLRIPTEQDQKRVLAEKTYRQGNLLRREDTAESFAKAIESYKEALRLFRDLGDRQPEAETLFYIGVLNNRLGEYQKAPEFFNQALLLFRDLGDRRLEAETFRNIGLLYHRLGEEQKALEHYKQALVLVRNVGDPFREGIVLETIGASYNTLGEKQK